jgi:hypothetical protein
MSTLIYEKKLDKTNLYCFDPHPLLSLQSARATVSSVALTYHQEPTKSMSMQTPSLKSYRYLILLVEMVSSAPSDVQSTSCTFSLHRMEQLRSLNISSLSPRHPTLPNPSSLPRIYLVTQSSYSAGQLEG